MGAAARLNPRSRAGGKPAAFVALHRLWRAVQFFRGDRAAFDLWLAGKALDAPQRAALETLWREAYPPPLVTLA